MLNKKQPKFKDYDNYESDDEIPEDIRNYYINK